MVFPTVILVILVEKNVFDTICLGGKLNIQKGWYGDAKNYFAGGGDVAVYGGFCRLRVGERPHVCACAAGDEFVLEDRHEQCGGASG